LGSLGSSLSPVAGGALTPVAVTPVAGDKLAPVLAASGAGGRLTPVVAAPVAVRWPAAVLAASGGGALKRCAVVGLAERFSHPVVCSIVRERREGDDERRLSVARLGVGCELLALIVTATITGSATSAVDAAARIRTHDQLR